MRRMTKKEYLDKLTKELGSMSYNDVNEILADIGDHFDEGIIAGKTEEEIAAHLGDPSELAADYKDGMTLPGILAKKIEKVNKPKPQEPTAQTVSFVILITVLLAIPAFFVLFGLVLIMLLLEIGAIAGAITLLASCWFYGAFLASGLFAGLTLLFLAIFGFALCYFSVKYFVFGTKWYIKSMQHVWHNGI